MTHLAPKGAVSTLSIKWDDRPDGFVARLFFPLLKPIVRHRAYADLIALKALVEARDANPL